MQCGSDKEVKRVNDEHAKITNLHKKSRNKLVRTNAAIWYSKVCRAKHLAPKYAHINIKNNNPRNVAI
jgi:hypothetical protein